MLNYVNIMIIKKWCRKSNKYYLYLERIKNNVTNALLQYYELL